MNFKIQKKICHNCKKDFIIEPDDFGFYEKIKVPPPTFCPECRLQRRLSWGNDWHLFKKKDESTGKEIFSIFPDESPVKIYNREYWNSDNWDPISYGKDFDFSKPFFEQFKELLYKVPLPANPSHNVINCQYCTNVNDIKNCYLVRGASFTEDSAYLIWDQASKQCFDSHMTNRCELSYGNLNTIICYKTFFSVDCENCHGMILCKDCVGCNDCVASIGLRNKSYYIFNQPYSKEEYSKKLIELNIGSEKAFQLLKHNAYESWLKFPQKYIHSRQNVNVSGDYIYESKNAKQCFRVVGVEDSKFVQNILTGSVKDCYDYTNYGDGVELIYESLVIGSGAFNIRFCIEAYPNSKYFSYCFYCKNSSDLFGCISLSNKKYCILNKQYTKEEYKKMVPKIIEHMKNSKEYGEFFPASLSPYPYQVTAAHEFFPLSEKEAKEKGFSIYSIKKQDYQITLKNENIPDEIKYTSESILDEVIECAHKGLCKHECTNAFRIIKSELDFCRRMNISLPRLCPNCRHYERLDLRNRSEFFHRQCQCKKGHFHGDKKCEVEFETSYSPGRPEIIYCEKFYQQEIY